MAELVTWFATSRLAILKLAQLLCLVISVLFLIDGRAQWSVYGMLFVAAIGLSIVTLLTLLAYFMKLHKPKVAIWTRMETLFNVVAAVVCLGFALVLLYDYIKMSNNEFRHHRYLPTREIGYDGWRNRILIVMFAQLIAAILYGYSLYRTMTTGLV